MKLPIVVVVWRDAVSESEWHDPADDIQPVICVTCGILLRKSKDFFDICGSMNDDSCGDRIVIPADWVQRMDHVGEVEVPYVGELPVTPLQTPTTTHNTEAPN